MLVTKTKKRIKAIVIVFTMLISMIASFNTASAATIKVEAEAYSNITFDAGVRTDTPEFSNGTILTYIGEVQGTKPHYIEYKVNSPNGGAYQVSAVSTLLTSRFTTDYFIQANSGEIITAATDAVPGSIISSKTYPDTVQKFQFGTLELEKGENIIRVIVDTNDKRSDNLIAFYFDYFELTEVPFGVRKIQPTETLGVYEQDKNISFKLQFNCKSQEEKKLRFKITDFWGATALESDFVIKPGTKDYTLNFGKFGLGWYMAEVFDGDKSMGTCSFSVVVPQRNRTKYEDTPFAIDFASDWLVRGDKDNVRDYIKTVKLAGIEWVRERFIWSDIETTKDVYNFEPMDKAIEPFKNAGLKVLDTFHDTPGWARKTGRNLPYDLFQIYEMQRDFAARYKDTVQAWEIWNEQDTIFCLEPADLYSSFMKAAAIGVADSGSGAKTIVGGYASSPTAANPYTDLSLQNGIMNYSDGYNFHAHLSYAASDNISQFKPKNDQRQYIASAYDNFNQPVWVTEAGMYMPVATGKDPTRDEIMSQAKYLVTSTVQSLASGTDKHFWFILPSYVESGRELGSFYASGSPYPCYTAEAFITHVLGKGKYIGVLDNLPDFAEGYMFDSGKGDVAVVWSEHGDKYTVKSDTPVTVYDIMGSAASFEPVNGEITLDISTYPIYIAFGGKSTASNYFHQEYVMEKNEPHTFTTGDRVVLNTVFGNEEFNAPKLDGYHISVNDGAELTVEVYNFNDKEVSGTVQPTAPEGYIISPASADVTVGAMSMKEITFKIEFNENVEANVTQFLKFDGTFDGEDISPSVSRVFSYKEVSVENITLLEGCNDPSNWDGSNITAGADPVEITKGIAGNSVRFDLKFNGGDRWFYPFFKIKDPTVFRGTTGICFEIYAEEDLRNISMNFFAYLNDGRQFYLGHSKGKQIKKGWNQVTVEWNKLELQAGPYGLTDYRPFDTDLITRISVGCNSPYDDVAPYEIAKLGYYTEEEKDTSMSEIRISGIDEGAHYKASEPRIFEAVLPDQEYKAISLTLNEKEFEGMQIDANTVTADFSGLERGCYTIQISAQTQYDFMVRKVVNIYID